MRPVSAIKETEPFAAISRLLLRAARTCRRFAADRRGRAAIDYALVLGIIALGGSAMISAIGIAIDNLFGTLDLELCHQVRTFCVLH